MNPKFRKLAPLARVTFAPLRFIMRSFFPITYVKWQYRYLTRHRLNLKHPQRYTEKLQYLRLFVYPYDPQVSRCADRIRVRNYLKENGFEQYLIPSLGYVEKFDQIDLQELPDKFVLKCNHACAFNQLILDKTTMNSKSLKKKFHKWLKTDYGRLTLERHYSNIIPKILIEQYLGEGDLLPTEYKIHVFNGKAKNLYVVTGRGFDIRYTNFYIDWTPFDGSQFNGWRKADQPISRPENFDEMVALAEKLAAPFPFVRVDLYNINGRIFFNEMTFTPAKGTLLLDDDSVDYQMGAWLDISAYQPQGNS